MSSDITGAVAENMSILLIYLLRPTGEDSHISTLQELYLKRLTVLKKDGNMLLTYFQNSSVDSLRVLEIIEMPVWINGHKNLTQLTQFVSY